MLLDDLLNKKIDWNILVENAGFGLAVFLVITSVRSMNGKPIFLNKKENNRHEES